MDDPKLPTSELARLAALAESPTVKLAHALSESHSQRLLKAIESDAVFKLSKQVEAATRAARLLETHQPAIASFMQKMESIQRAWPDEAFFAKIDRISNSVSAISRAAEAVAAALPSRQAIDAITYDLARAVTPYQAAFASISAWQDNLANRMVAMQAAWAIPDRLSDSILGFARLSRLSDAVHVLEPFSEPVTELLREELGEEGQSDSDEAPFARDANAVDAGLNPELIAFPPAAYGQVVLAAGFEFRFSQMPVPQAIEGADPTAVYDPIHAHVLAQVEQRLRRVVEERLQGMSPKWIKQRIPEDTRVRWTERQTEDRDAGRPVYPLVQYADFMDLADIIGQSNNWRDAFQAIFQNREDFLVSLRRLHPVRKAIAHGRPLGRSDVLTLVSEATRILGALGVRILN